MVLPLLDGAVHLTVAVVLLAETLAVPIVGAFGLLVGVIELDELE